MKKEITDEKIIGELAGLVSGGLLKPEDVVEAARSRSSSLHDYFTWDDSEAAKNFRLWQARELIQCTVRYIPTNGDKKPVRVFVSLTSDRNEEGGGYRITADVLSHKELRTEMLEDALAEMKRFEDKYEPLKELAEIFRAFREVREALNLK